KVEPAKASAGTTTSTSSSNRTNRTSSNQTVSNGLGRSKNNTGTSQLNRTESDDVGDVMYNDILVDDSHSDHLYENKMMQILNSKAGSASSGKEWIVLAPGDEEDEEECSDCQMCSHGCSSSRSTTSKSQEQTNRISNTEKSEKSKTQKPLTCGKKVNSTVYDHLKGISERHLHSHIPEPDVAVVFQSIGKSAEVDINDLEQKLRKTRRDVEKAGPEQREHAAQVYNLIGNFWRIKGNTQTSIECFRKALSITPNNSNVLLNLARVLLNLQYLDDAILLAWRSLKLHHEENNTASSWLQHFTLGQALRALAERGGSEPHPQHARQAAAHFQQALALNPGFAPAKLHLRELEARGFTGEGIAADWLSGTGGMHGTGSDDDNGNLPSVAQLTLFVLLSLGVGLLFGVVISLEASLAQGKGEETGGANTGSGSRSSSMSAVQLQSSQQRHFNRAMAMRSMKLGINRKLCGRSRKNNGSGF
ncbi:tetratricopeptide repeat protein 17-like, partial [Elysia marginata]